jgi:hypothetical protein
VVSISLPSLSRAETQGNHWGVTKLLNFNNFWGDGGGAVARKGIILPAGCLCRARIRGIIVL